MTDTTSRDKNRAELGDHYVGVVDHGELTIYDEQQTDGRWITANAYLDLEDAR